MLSKVHMLQHKNSQAGYTALILKQSEFTFYVRTHILAYRVSRYSLLRMRDLNADTCSHLRIYEWVRATQQVTRFVAQYGGFAAFISGLRKIWIVMDVFISGVFCHRHNFLQK